MHAILITTDNLQKVAQEFPDIPDDVIVNLDQLYSHRTYYFISGYVSRLGLVEDWTILPDYAVQRNFEIDFRKANTDWDQIVRK